MKKLLASILALTMSVTLLAGCEEGSTSDNDSSSKADSSSVADSSVTDSSEPDSDTPDSSEPDSSEPDSSEPDSSEPDSSEPDSSAIDGGEIVFPVRDGFTFSDDTYVADESLYEQLGAGLLNGSYTVEMEQDGSYLFATTDGSSIFFCLNEGTGYYAILASATEAYFLDIVNSKYFPYSGQTIDTIGEPLPIEEIYSSEAVYECSGTVNAGGAEYTFEYYTSSGSDAENFFIFNNDGAVCGIFHRSSDSEEYEFRSMFISAEAAEENLYIPSGYTQMTDDEFVAWTEGMQG